MRAGRDPLERLVRRVRGRLWLGAIARAQRVGLWVAAAVLTAGAAARWHLGAPAPAVSAALAAVPLVIALLAGAARRPPWGAAVAAADRRAGADALLVTACSLPATASGAGALVRSRALRALPAWEQRLRSSGDRLALPLLPFVVMLAAAPLLALQPTASPLAPPGLEAARSAAPGPKASLAQVIGSFRGEAPTTAEIRSGEQPETSRGSPRRDQRAPAPRGAGPASGAEPAAGAVPAGEAVADGRPGARPASVADHPAASVAAVGGAGLEAAGTGGATPGGLAAEGPVDPRERAVVLTRRGAGGAQAAGAGGGLDPIAPGAGGPGGAAPPASPPAVGPTRPGAYGVAQRHLVARYFALRGEGER